MIKSLFYYSLLIFFCAGCRSSLRSNDSKLIQCLHDADTISFRSIHKKFPLARMRVNHLLGFDSLQHRREGTEIRIGRSYFLTPIDQYIVLKQKGNEWAGYTVQMSFDSPVNKRDSIRFLPTCRDYNPPKIGWTDFTQRLLKLDLLTLDQFSDADMYGGDTDGNAIVIEYSKNGIYKVIDIKSPGSGTGDARDRLRGILDLIKQHLEGDDFIEMP